MALQDDEKNALATLGTNVVIRRMIQIGRVWLHAEESQRALEILRESDERATAVIRDENLDMIPQWVGPYPDPQGESGDAGEVESPGAVHGPGGQR